MNCFAHALPFLDDPYFAVGACIPDWLSACDRRCRARENRARELFDHADPETDSLVRGVVQHHQDDDWFHRTLCFNELSMEFSLEIRELLGGESGFRPGLLGHIIIELFLDAYLDQVHPGKLESYYRLVNLIDEGKVERVINRFASRPTVELAKFIEKFRQARYLFDYRDDKKLIFRINQVFHRVKLAPIASELYGWMPVARKKVYEQVPSLLPQYSLVF